MKEINFHSLTSLPIELWHKEHFLSNASAFFLRSFNGLYLVTNWHVLSGRHSRTGQTLHRSGALPTDLRISFHGQKLGTHVGPISLRLIEHETPLWQQHRLGQEVDIACLKIESVPEKAKIYFPTDENAERPLRKRIGANCFVVGHPIKSPITQLLPIWKRGTIASEYHFPFQGKACFIVDTTTSEGMSGSPVFLHEAGTVQFEGDDKLHFTNTQVSEFVGIYSGRLSRNDEGVLDLGFVWKKELLNEMLSDPSLGDHKIIN